jgi:MarR family transcriptional regulator, temperature-dependent positive regulator of motility
MDPFPCTCPHAVCSRPVTHRFDQRLLDEPGHLIRRAHQLAVATFHEVHGRQITPVQYAVLRALQASPGIDQVTLAEQVALDTSTTADIATRLEAKGWIVRELMARRQRSLRLTPEGQAVLAEMLPRVDPMYERLLATALSVRAGRVRAPAGEVRWRRPRQRQG